MVHVVHVWSSSQCLHLFQLNGQHPGFLSYELNKEYLDMKYLLKKNKKYTYNKAFIFKNAFSAFNPDRIATTKTEKLLSGDIIIQSHKVKSTMIPEI